MTITSDCQVIIFVSVFWYLFEMFLPNVPVREPRKDIFDLHDELEEDRSVLLICKGYVAINLRCALPMDIWHTEQRLVFFFHSSQFHCPKYEDYSFIFQHQSFIFFNISTRIYVVLSRNSPRKSRKLFGTTKWKYCKFLSSFQMIL